MLRWVFLLHWVVFNYTGPDLGRLVKYSPILVWHESQKSEQLMGSIFIRHPLLSCSLSIPALLVTLTASAAIGSVSFGFALLLAFALGRSIPIILGAISIGWIESLQIFSRYQRIFEVISGLTLIISGLYLLNEYFYIL